METETQHQLAVAELAPIAQQSAAYAATIEGMEIHDDDELALAGDLVKDLNHYRRKLEDKRKSLVQPLNKVTSDINAMFKAPRDKIEQYRDLLKKKMNDYVSRKELLERQKREQEEREAKEREDRLRKAAEATREATHDEQSEIAEVLDKQADDAAIAAEKAPAKRAAPVRGNKATVSTVKTWKAEVVDVRAVCAAIGDGRLPKDIVQISQVAIDGLARAVEQEQEKDGLKFYQHIGTVAR